MFKLIITSLLLIMLSACSPLGMLTDNTIPDIEVQAGKTNEKTVGVKADEFTVSKVEETVTAETIVEDTEIGTIEAEEVSIDERVPFWIWLLAILGWVLPSPAEIYRGLGNLLINIKKFIKE